MSKIDNRKIVLFITNNTLTSGVLAGQRSTVTFPRDGKSPTEVKHEYIIESIDDSDLVYIASQVYDETSIAKVVSSLINSTKVDFAKKKLICLYFYKKLIHEKN